MLQEKINLFINYTQLKEVGVIHPLELGQVYKKLHITCMK